MKISPQQLRLLLLVPLVSLAILPPLINGFPIIHNPQRSSQWHTTITSTSIPRVTSPSVLGGRIGKTMRLSTLKMTVTTSSESPSSLVTKLLKNIQILKDTETEAAVATTTNDEDSDKNQNKGSNTINWNQQEIKRITKDLETSFLRSVDDSNDEDDKRFEPLLGLYDVAHVQTTRKDDNPVGGKWTRKNKLAQKLFSTRRTFQHLLPSNFTGCTTSDDSIRGTYTTSTSSTEDKMGSNGSSTKGDKLVTVNEDEGGLLKDESIDVKSSNIVAEAINVISLDALWNLIRLTIILRGDAVPVQLPNRSSSGSNTLPLSNLAVKVFFDPPRIIFGKRGRFFNLQLGPSTSVILDTTYADDQIRIGMGGTSGTRFIFQRCANSTYDQALEGKGDGDEPNEFQMLLKRQPMKRSKLLSILGSVGCLGIYSMNSASSSFASKLIGAFVTGLVSIFSVGVLFSTGGVEPDREQLSS